MEAYIKQAEKINAPAQAKHYFLFLLKRNKGWSVIMPNKQPKWIPVIKEDFMVWSEKKQDWVERKHLKDTDDFDGSTIEYGIAREDSHGVTSWGWASLTEKIVLFDEIEKPSDLPRLKQICVEFADFMNKREGNG